MAADEERSWEPSSDREVIRMQRRYLHSVVVLMIALLRACGKNDYTQRSQTPTSLGN